MEMGKDQVELMRGKLMMLAIPRVKLSVCAWKIDIKRLVLRISIFKGQRTRACVYQMILI